MSNISGNHTRGLMEAYASVYAPQELAEEQIWEEVESWVNSLIEEGYDLSEYTWEDMYEAYIEEIAVSPSKNMQQQARTALQSGKTLRAGGFLGRSNVSLDSAATNKSGRSTLRVSGGTALKDPTIKLGGQKYYQAKLGGKDVYVSGSGKKPTPSASQNLKGLSIGPGGFNINGRPAATAARPSGGSPAPAARPSGGSPAPAARPSGGSPATAKAAPSAPVDKEAGMKAWAKANPTLAAKVKPGQSGYGTIQQARAASGGSAAAAPAAKLDTGKITSTAFSGSTPALAKPLSSSPEIKQTASLAATPKPTPVAPKATGSKKPGSTFEQYDAYDIVLEYLLDNGHADTVDEAHYVMMEMDGEMIANICSEQSSALVTPEQRRADELKYKVKRTTPATAKTSPRTSRMPL